ARALVHVEGARLAEHRRGFVGERLGEVADLAARLQSPDELCRCRNAHVSCDERLLEPLPGLVVGRIERGRGKLIGERSPALAERVAQAPEEAGLRLLLLSPLLVAEERGPRGQAATASGGSRLDTICETPS